MITLTEQLKCAQRELAYRRLHYPAWAKTGRMAPDAATRQLEAQEAIVETIDKMVGLEEVSLTMRGDCKPKIKPEELFL